MEERAKKRSSRAKECEDQDEKYSKSCRKEKSKHKSKSKSSKRLEYASSDSHLSEDSEYSDKKSRRKRSDRSRSRERKSSRRQRKSSSPVSRSEIKSKSKAKGSNGGKKEEIAYKYISNPYGEEGLKKKFVWKKKEKDDREKGLSKRDIEKRKIELREETEIELKKLQERRKQREHEMILKEREMTRLQQEAENEQLGDWKERENLFHLEQAKKRAEIRITQGRAKPIDVLAINLKVATSPDETHEFLDYSYDLQFYEPWKIVDNLNLDEISDLYSDIQMYLALEKVQENLQFWESMLIVCDARKQKLQDLFNSTEVTKTVEDEIFAMLDSKNASELTQLQNQIRKKVAGNEPVDMDYWEEVLKQIIVEQAKLKINEYHKRVMSILVKRTRETQKIEAKRHQEELAALLSKSKAGKSTEEDSATRRINEQNSLEATDNSNTGGDNVSDIVEVFNENMEPILSEKIAYDDRRLPLYTASEDVENLFQNRLTVLKYEYIAKRQVDGPNDSEDEDEVSKKMMLLEEAKNPNEEEQMFATEASLGAQSYSWEDKYKPRKPKYFNKVHTGYEWNKYNQTHYDFDNPPPRVVQGYKFNIFYPDLIDKTVTPTYKIEPDLEFMDPNDPEKKIVAFGKKTFKGETVMIRFIAGPPYEDLAFRIVNREWEYSRKYGFRNSFNGNVLQLHFRFRRQFYKR